MSKQTSTRPPVMTQTIKNLKHNSTVKLITIIFITVAMLIPVSMVEMTIHERSGLKAQAETSISDRWGGKQKISAPVLAIPYKEKKVERISQNNAWQTANKQIENKKISYIDRTIYLLADNVSLSTTMKTEIRYLGIYEMPVYITESTIRGNFNRQDLEKINKKLTNINWKQARVILPIDDVRGIRSISKLSFGKKSIDFIPGQNNSVSFRGIDAPVNLSNKIDKNINFSLDISLSGSKQLNYLPLARTSNIILTSDWSNPGFTGSYLPITRNITQEGFSAEWKILGLNRSFGQSLSDSLDHNSINNSKFGITLFQPADIYQQNIRSVKYAALFIALTFMAFFLFEIFFGLNIHPIQYFFNGGALSTFYLLLLALSEHLHFSMAYLLSSISIVLLMTGYSMTILKQRKRGVLIGLITAIIYSFLYFLIQSEQNSLLFGAIGFFVSLSTIMYLTRNINWYNINSEMNSNAAITSETDKTVTN